MMISGTGWLGWERKEEGSIMCHDLGDWLEA